MSHVEQPIADTRFYRLDGPQRAPSTDGALGDGSIATSAALGALIMRGADCLIAALQSCTSQAGLNESRYRVLARLANCSGGECSQTELAAKLLQSESNLSTLLERMGTDGLILRRRCEADRRRSLIRISPAGALALDGADRTRAAVIARLLRQIPREDAGQLVSQLARVVERLEHSLDGSSSELHNALV